MNRNGIKRLLFDISNKSPTITGPTITPNCHPASNLANPEVLFSLLVISAILPPEAGLTALPRSPLINLVRTSRKKRTLKGIKYDLA